MICVGFCDDEMEVQHQFLLLLNQYRSSHSCEICCKTFCSPLDLLAEVERGTRFDILFLDVLMPGQNGIHAAQEIRNVDSNVKIIFLTNSPEYALESYSVGAFYYQMKPLEEHALFRLMDSVLAVCRQENENSLLLRCKNGITRVEIRKLVYCEILHRTLFIHLADGTVLESIGSLDELCIQLQPYGCFLRVHRSFLVNLSHIQSLSFRAAVLSGGAQIPIPRGKYNEIKQAFLDYAFQNGQVIL